LKELSRVSEAEERVRKLREDAGLKEPYLDLTQVGQNKSYWDVKQYGRRKR
jgi:hypothetical protein